MTPLATGDDVVYGREREAFVIEMAVTHFMARMWLRAFLSGVSPAQR